MRFNKPIKNRKPISCPALFMHLTRRHSLAGGAPLALTKSLGRSSWKEKETPQVQLPCGQWGHSSCLAGLYSRLRIQRCPRTTPWSNWRQGAFCPSSFSSRLGTVYQYDELWGKLRGAKGQFLMYLPIQRSPIIDHIPHYRLVLHTILLPPGYSEPWLFWWLLWSQETTTGPMLPRPSSDPTSLWDLPLRKNCLPNPGGKATSSV